jgi:hypothetical protein
LAEQSRSAERSAGWQNKAAQNEVIACWGVPDPAAIGGTEADRLAAFRKAFDALERRIRRFAALPLEQLDRVAIMDEVSAIDCSPPPPPPSDHCSCRGAKDVAVWIGKRYG